MEPEKPQDDFAEEGSHQELMYSLGVNLARQLGDVRFVPPSLIFRFFSCVTVLQIRPLVEDSEELTHVAKGLLDTVIGRLDDESQRIILSKVNSIE